MDIEVRLDTNRAILVLRGDLTTGEHLRFLSEKVDGLLRDGYREVVIDLESVGYVDSAGLHELVKVYSSIHGFGAIRLVGLVKTKNRALGSLLLWSAIAVVAVVLWLLVS